MKLATLRDGSRDGRLVVVSSDNQRAAPAPVPTLQAALDTWDDTEAELRSLAQALEQNPSLGECLEAERLGPPLPRAYEWIDGSAFLEHVVLVRRARGAEPPASLWSDPLVYQGGSGIFLGPHDPLVLHDPEWGLDFEGEVCVVLGDTPQGTKSQDAHKYVRLVMLCNDVTLRGLIPAELKKGFGFFQGKPATAFAPFAVTPDQLGPAWRDGRAHLRLGVWRGDDRVGNAHAGPEMHFSFFDLIEHITKTRGFTAGTIVGSGTVSNADPSFGSSCLAEQRMRETLAHGQPQTPWLQHGERVRMSVHDGAGRNLFGTLDQRVVAP